MRIALLTLGSRGDTQPFISLAIRLKEMGHDVVLGARPDYTELVEKYGIEFMPLGPHITPHISDMSKVIASGNFFKFMLKTRQLKGAFTEKTAEDAMLAVVGAEAIFFKYSWDTGYTIAEKLGVPCAGVMFFPITPTRAFPCFLVGDGKDKGRLLNAFFWWLSQMVIWQDQHSYNKKLRRKMGLKPVSYLGPLKLQAQRKMPVFYAYSPTLLPKPSDWPERMYVTGVWPSLPPVDWHPSPELVKFIESGSAPVFIGFGSMEGKAGRAQDIAVKALELSGKRGIVQSQFDEDESDGVLPETVFLIKDVYHQWLFPKMAAVVHHGGVGTTMTGLLSGVPSILIPHTIDQHSWGRHVYALGVGPESIPSKGVTAELLAKAIEEATTNEMMNSRAREIGKMLEKEDGVKETMDVFFQYYRDTVNHTH